MQVIVNGLAINYDQVGSGPLLLMIHGWGSSLKSFDPLATQLRANFSCLSVDLPGFGGSQAPDGGWGLEDYARFLHAFLKKVNAGQLRAIIGHSNGAAVAIKGLSSQSLKANKLVLIAGAGVRGRQKGRKLMFKLVAKTGKAVTIVLPVAVRQRLRRKLYARSGSDMLLKPSMETTFRRTVAEDMLSAASQLSLPVLLIYGEDDTVTPPAFGELYHQAITGSTLEIITGTDHFVHEAMPDRVAALIREFLK